MSFVSHAATVKAVLHDIEGKRDEVRLRKEFYAEVRETLAILDDLEAGKISRSEARRRYRWLQATRRKEDKRNG